MSSTASCTPLSTSVGFSPRRISTMPSTPVGVADAENARRLRRADLHLPDIADEHRNALVLGHHDVLDIAGVLDQTHAADHHRLLIVVQQRAARVLIVGAHRLRDLPDRQVVFVHRLRIDHHLVLLDQPAERRHVGDARHLPEARLDHPIFQVAQFDVAVALAFHHVAVELADGRGQRAERRRHVVRQRGVAQFFEHHRRARNNRRSRRRRSTPPPRVRRWCASGARSRWARRSARARWAP